jgi:uncharacterized protein (TIGR02117 family)
MKVKSLIIALSLSSACASQPQKVEPTVVGGQAIYIISHGWHTGFIIPANTIEQQIPKLKQRFTDTPYLEIGWGDKGFYQTKEITTGLTLRAMFWSAGSVIHAVAVPENIKGYFPHSEIEKLCLTRKDYAALIQFISDSFYRNYNGDIVELKNGIYGNSQFYQGAGNYHLLNTCNKWVAKGLASAGMDIVPTFKLTAGSVMDTVRDYKHALTVDSSEQPFPVTTFECW